MANADVASMAIIKLRMENLASLNSRSSADRLDWSDMPWRHPNRGKETTFIVAKMDHRRT
jgi:hypothetical protein